MRSIKKLVLLAAILAMVLEASGIAIAQTPQNTSSSQAPSQNTPSNQTQSPPTSNNQTANDQSTLPCDVSLFRLEQQELVQSGYPTPVSSRARQCEQLGYVNPYPAPAMVGPDNVVYPYDPIEGQYLYLDSKSGLYYILDPATGKVSVYDPVKGIFL